MRLLPVTAASLAVIVLAAACSGGSAGTSPSAPPSPSDAPPASAPPAGGAPATADQLDGRTFVVTGASGYQIVEGSEITLRFEDGRLGIHAGCNQASGGYEVAPDGTLTVGAMMTTEMACDEPLMTQDAFLADLVNGALVTLDGDTLTLVKGDVTLTAVDEQVARPALPLEGTTWTVDGLITNQAVSSMPAGVTASLVFVDGQVQVEAGCNRGSGSAEIGDTSITFGPVATTKMACEPDAMAVEQHVLGVLAGDVSFEIERDTLTLVGAGGGLTATGS